jgi:hypothetical protein
MQEILSRSNSCKKILWKRQKTGIPETPSKTTFLWKIPPENTGKKRNPQGFFFYCFWAPKIDSCQTGIGNLAPEPKGPRRHPGIGMRSIKELSIT